MLIGITTQSETFRGHQSWHDERFFSLLIFTYSCVWWQEFVKNPDKKLYENLHEKLSEKLMISFIEMVNSDEKLLKNEN